MFIVIRYNLAIMLMCKLYKNHNTNAIDFYNKNIYHDGILIRYLNYNNMCVLMMSLILFGVKIKIKI